MGKLLPPERRETLPSSEKISEESLTKLISTHNKQEQDDRERAHKEIET